jgi:peptidyl-tRNA hydrolase, PTH1 family
LILILHSRSKNIDFLIVGLGNPGEEYEHTLHNVGFDVVDLLGAELCCNYWKHGCGADYAETETRDGKNIVLAKPQSYMNTSGGPVSTLMKEYKLVSSQLIVVHDDLDLEPGKLRIKQGGSAGGHNGVKSIINKIGGQNFVHVKIGVGHPKGRKPVIDWVLSKPLKEFAEPLEQVKSDAVLACIDLTNLSVPKVQNKYN